jgi:acetyltransferase
MCSTGLRMFFNPSSIAIVGVSDNPKKVGNLVAKNLIAQGYESPIYFINPKYKTLFEKRVFAKLSDVGQSIDLVVLAVPVDIALGYLDEIKAVGTKNIVIFAAGFKETSTEGEKKEKLLKEKAGAYGFNILGPNCIGFINTDKKINTTFLRDICPAGNIGFVSQSGALGSLMVDSLVNHKNLGFSYFVSLGNKTIVDETDVLEFLADDPKTKVIAMYLEDVKDGDRFKQILKKTTQKKPVVVLKSGVTAEGSQAAISHTGSMMGNDQIYQAVFDQCGAIRAESFSEFMTLLKLFSFDRIPFSKNTLILSNAGGVGVLLTDELVKQKLSLITITEEVKQNIIQSMGGDKISLHNPIDLLGDARAFDYEQAIKSTIKEKEIGSVVILLTPQANTEIPETASVIARAQAGFDRPIYPIFMGEKSVGNPHLFFEEKNIASFSTYDFLPKALAKIIAYKKYLGLPEQVFPTDNQGDSGEIGRTILSGRGKSFLNLVDSMEVIERSGIPVENLYMAANMSDLASKVKNINYPVVLKIASEKITHKTEVQGVIADIRDDEGLKTAYDHLCQISQGKDVLLQKMVKGHELIVGAKRDSVFGIMVMVGLGGIYTEVIKEAVSFNYPFSNDYFCQIIEKTKLLPFIKGFRGSYPLDTDKLYRIMFRIGQLLYKHPQIKEVDINPLMLVEGNLVAVDGRIVLL